MFTDTDSLFYEIKTDNIYEDLLNDKELHVFDNCDYPKYSAFFFDKNEKVTGKMKDAAAGMVIKEFIGLLGKMYSYIINNKTTKKKKKKKKKKKNVREYLDTP